MLSIFSYTPRSLNVAFLSLTVFSLNVSAQTTDQWLLGDWNGARTKWAAEGYSFDLSYASEMAASIDGGYNDKTTARYADRWAANVEFNLETILGWDKATFQLGFANRNGQSLNPHLEDPRQPIVTSGPQEIYGREETGRLTRMWYRQRSSDERWDVKIGRMAEGEDFAASGCSFQNNSMCGALVGHGIKIWYSYPVAMWGLRVRYLPTDNLGFQYGIYQHNPSLAEKKNRRQLDFGGGTGIMHIAETRWKTQYSSAHLPGTYRLGAYLNTSTADDIYLDVNGDPAALTNLEALHHSARYGFYFVFDQQLTYHADNAARGFVLLMHTALNDKRASIVDYQFQIGFKYNGPFSQRIEDDIGFGFSKVHVNDRLNERQRLINEVNGVEDYTDPLFTPLQFSEYATELHYTYVVSPAVTLRPNVQYLKNLGGVKEIDSALVAGLTISVKF